MKALTVGCFSLKLSIFRYVLKGGISPAGTCRKNDVVLTSMRRHHVASMLIRHHFGTKCPLGGRFRTSLSFVNTSFLRNLGI